MEEEPEVPGTQTAQEKPLTTVPDAMRPAFDYSGLTDQTVEDLHFAENEYRHGKQMAERGLVHMGNAIAAAHDALCGVVALCDNSKHGNRGEDTFRAWCVSIGITKDTAYRLLQVSALLDGSSPRQQKILKELSPTLLYAVAKPSAPAELVEQVSGAVQLTDTVRFCAGCGMLCQEKSRPEAAAAPAFSLPFAPADGAEFALPGGQTLKTRLFVSGFREKTQGVHKKDLKNRADYARITLLYSALTLRTRQPGDRFRPAGRGLSKPLRKWMNEAGIPAGIRDGLPLLAAGSEILWVCGEGFAEGLAPDEETEQVLQLELENGGTTHEHE